MKLHTCEQCGGPRRSLSNPACSRCRKHPKDPCPECGQPKGAAQERCIRCHARTTSIATGEQRRKRVDRTCLQCGKIFEVIAAKIRQADGGRYCSAACRVASISRKVELECPVCQRRFLVSPVTVRRGRRFCSHACRATVQIGANHWAWRGGTQEYYGPSWRAAKRAARKRDGTCQNCGVSPEMLGHALDVHHLVSFRTFGVERHEEANCLENLICYCRTCHAFVEWGGNRRLSTV